MTGLALKTAKTAKFPVFFPVNRELKVETGSQQTASTANLNDGLGKKISHLEPVEILPYYPSPCLIFLLSTCRDAIGEPQVADAA